MSLNANELGIAVGDLAQTWTGAQIQKIHMDGPRVLLMTLRTSGKSAVIRISVVPEASYLCVVDARGPADAEASSFCMILRKWMKGARLIEIEQVNEDRVVRLNTRRAHLVIEMLGGRSCFVLCDSSGAIMASSPAEASRESISVGVIYEPPVKRAFEDAPPRFADGEANEWIVDRYASTELTRTHDETRARLSKLLRRKLKRQRRLVNKIGADRDRAMNDRGFERMGELLKLHLKDLKRGMASIDVQDVLFGTGELISIPLEASLSPTENLDTLFKRSRKAKRALEKTATRYSQERKRLETLEEHALLLDDYGGEELSDLEALLGAPPEKRGAAKARRGGRPVRLPYHSYRGAEDRPIFVGRSAADNDRLTLHVAKPNDLWLHARGFRGSHVVVPLRKNEEPTQEMLLDGATLAARFSDAKNDETVEVSYTRRKYVQKPKGAAPGLVVLAREKVVLLRMEPARLDRLLESKSGA